MLARLARAALPRASALPPRRHSPLAMATAALPGADAAGGVAVVYVTAPSADVATSLATSLVNDRLAACVNIVPSVTSVYRWQGAVETATEAMLIIKTRQDALSALTAAVGERHPYDEPEVLALPALGGSPSYLAWVMSEAGGGTK